MADVAPKPSQNSVSPPLISTSESDRTDPSPADLGSIKDDLRDKPGQSCTGQGPDNALLLGSRPTCLLNPCSTTQRPCPPDESLLPEPLMSYGPERPPLMYRGPEAVPCHATSCPVAPAVVLTLRINVVSQRTFA